MSKHTAIAASFDLKPARNFSFLALLAMGVYMLFATPAFADDPLDPCDPSLPKKDCTESDTTTYDDGSTMTTVTAYDVDGNATKSYTSTGSDTSEGHTAEAAAEASTTASSSNGNLTGVAGIICDVVYILIFDIGRGIATLSIIAVGIAAMFGKATWTQAVTVGVGIGIIFGALTMSTVLTAHLSSILTAFSAMPCIPSTTGR